ncbi:Tkp5 protein [Vanderwaltozyma polyspora DSM 70294]|uniref:Tkp5 protein n=1 Tax=Vanderwaltozyma polyspora (strain ATCC 22028 / DSM 70294 / BCRC 21397 / CBS 2163 / NBRC 10782 / NRRL Y-8283 / UCD 57-17) TaxID=436907 RepID=A7TR35_VANPO|nr:Tkp5 protein [Vanderwaltozyma polyspora DSM 70294]EDO15283.1 Tkp5 protein [Vanderwaltozyma polyspora DSM 70294]
MTIRDAYSRYYTVIHLNAKKDAIQELIDWINRTENFFSSRGGYKVGSIKTDNGGEFKNTVLHEYLISKGITHELTIPYSSFQNGAVERAHRTIEERARSLLISGRVLPELWSEAVFCAVYLINRTPVPSKKNFIPAALWVQVESFTFDNLGTFGCTAYISLPPQLRDSKLSPTSIKGVHVGYDSHHKGYRIYEIETGRIFVSDQVKFDKNVFPLEGVSIAELPQKYATSPINGVPSYSTVTSGSSSYCPSGNITILSPLLSPPSDSPNGNDIDHDTNM